MRVVGLDVHRSFAVAAYLEDGLLSSGGRVDLTRDAVITFGKRLRSDDEVVIEATGNTVVIVHLLRPFVRLVVIANPLQGSTALELLGRLRERGVRTIRLACTHGLFSGDALKRLNDHSDVLEAMPGSRRWPTAGPSLWPPVGPALAEDSLSCTRRAHLSQQRRCNE
jgi:hypothetical protein